MVLGIGNINLTEIVVVLVVAIIVFGRNLPQVAARAAVQFGRARRSMQTLWRETGIEDEIRTVQAEIREKAPSGLSPAQLARDASKRIKAELMEVTEDDPEHDPSRDPDRNRGKTGIDIEEGGERPPGDSK